MQTVDVHCGQINMDVKMPYDPNQKVQQFVEQVIQDCQLPKETNAKLYANSHIVDPQAVMSGLQNGLEIKLNQIVEIIATNRIQNQLTLKIDLWGKINIIEKEILRVLHSQYDYQVILNIGDYELESDYLCIMSNISANSIIQYRLVVSFNISISQELHNLQIDAYTTIRELREFVSQLFKIEDVFQLQYEGTIIEDSDQVTLFSYSIKPGNTIYLLPQPIQQPQILREIPQTLTIFLCNQADYADEREITVNNQDQVKVLDGEIKDPNIQVIYKYAGHTLDNNKSFLSQEIPNNAKIRYLLQIKSQQIKIFFENTFTNEMIEVLVQLDEQIYVEISKILKLPKSQIAQLYEIIYNSQQTNLDMTYRTLGASFGSSLVLRFKSIEVDLYFQTKRYTLPFHSEATVGEVLQYVEEKFKISDSELFQNGKPLPLDKLLKEVYKNPLNLIESDKNNEYFHQTKEIMLIIQPQNFELLMTINSDDTVKDLVNKLRRDQGIPQNQPMIVRTFEGAELYDEDIIDYYHQLKVEVYDYLHLKFENLITKETHQDIAAFDDSIKFYAETRGLKNCVFYHNQKKLNPNESFRVNQIYNNDTIQFETQKELISIHLKYKKQNSVKFEPEIQIDYVSLDQTVEQFQNDLMVKFNLHETELFFLGQKLPKNSTLKECNIHNNATITAIFLVYTIQIRDQNQKTTYTHYLRPSEKIEILKDKLSSKIQSQQIVFKYEGKIISEAKTLRELGIGDQSVIEINY